MAQTLHGITRSQVVTALDTYNYTAETSGLFLVRVAMSELPPTGLTVLIQRNSSTIATYNSQPSNEQRMFMEQHIQCVVGDILSVVLSSTSLPEEAPNAIKGQINIHAGAS
jgi:hypothetical protein